MVHIGEGERDAAGRSCPWRWGWRERGGRAFDGDVGRDAASTGAVVSWTVMVWLAVLVLPQLSVAVQVRVRV